MSAYAQNSGNQQFWGTQDTSNDFYGSDFNRMRDQTLDFEPDINMQQGQNYYYPPQDNFNPNFEMSTLDPKYSNLGPNTASFENEEVEFDEPPLLEELEIYPDRIMEKTLAVLNPFRSHSLADDSDFLSKDTDLAGPLVFCCVLAVCLFLSGNKANFGYIYGLSAMSCIAMYCLLTLMTTTSGVFTLTSVASILGYCLLPIVGLSVLGVFVTLHSLFGIVLSILAVVWSSLSASRLFVALSGDQEQRPLIAYPCALVCGVFTLVVVF